MPIYAYKCTSCGHAEDVMRKLADAPLSICTKCGKDTFAKQLTAPGFQLKGSGWYATDFKSSGKPVEAKSSDKSDAKAEPKADAKADSKAEGKSDSKTESKPESKAESKPAAAAPASTD